DRGRNVSRLVALGGLSNHEKLVNSDLGSNLEAREVQARLEPANCERLVVRASRQGNIVDDAGDPTALWIKQRETYRAGGRKRESQRRLQAGGIGNAGQGGACARGKWRGLHHAGIVERDDAAEL